jgi:hypothetical protein
MFSSRVSPGSSSRTPGSSGSLEPDRRPAPEQPTLPTRFSTSHSQPPRLPPDVVLAIADHVQDRRTVFNMMRTSKANLQAITPQFDAMRLQEHIRQLGWTPGGQMLSHSTHVLISATVSPQTAREAVGSFRPDRPGSVYHLPTSSARARVLSTLVEGSSGFAWSSNAGGLPEDVLSAVHQLSQPHRNDLLKQILTKARSLNEANFDNVIDRLDRSITANSPLSMKDRTDLAMHVSGLLLTRSLLKATSPQAKSDVIRSAMQASGGPASGGTDALVDLRRPTGPEHRGDLLKRAVPMIGIQAWERLDAAASAVLDGIGTLDPPQQAALMAWIGQRCTSMDAQGQIRVASAMAQWKDANPQVLSPQAWDAIARPFVSAAVSSGDRVRIDAALQLDPSTRPDRALFLTSLPMGANVTDWATAMRQADAYVTHSNGRPSPFRAAALHGLAQCLRYYPSKPQGQDVLDGRRPRTHLFEALARQLPHLDPADRPALKQVLNDALAHINAQDRLACNLLITQDAAEAGAALLVHAGSGFDPMTAPLLSAERIAPVVLQARNFMAQHPGLVSQDAFQHFTRGIVSAAMANGSTECLDEALKLDATVPPDSAYSLADIIYGHASRASDELPQLVDRFIHQSNGRPSQFRAAALLGLVENMSVFPQSSGAILPDKSVRTHLFESVAEQLGSLEDEDAAVLHGALSRALQHVPPGDLVSCEMMIARNNDETAAALLKAFLPTHGMDTNLIVTELNFMVDNELLTPAALGKMHHQMVMVLHADMLTDEQAVALRALCDNLLSHFPRLDVMARAGIAHQYASALRNGAPGGASCWLLDHLDALAQHPLGTAVGAIMGSLREVQPDTLSSAEQSQLEAVLIRLENGPPH